jgi:hypothetical protein
MEEAESAESQIAEIAEGPRYAETDGPPACGRLYGSRGIHDHERQPATKDACDREFVSIHTARSAGPSVHVATLILSSLRASAPQ